MPGRQLIPLHLIVVLLLSMFLQGEQACSQPAGMQTLQTRFYELTTDLDEDSARKLGVHMDVVFEAYRKMFERFQGHPTKRLDAYIFREQSTYLEFLMKKFGMDGTGSGGMFIQRGDDGALVVFEGGQGLARVREVLQHEGFHQFAAILFPGIPLWANEGFAELFEKGVVIDGEIDEFHVGAIPRGTLLQLQRARGENTLLPFDSFFLIDSKAWSDGLKDGAASLNYMQAWSLVHFFLYAENAKWQNDFLQFLALLNKGMDWQQAFSTVFKTTDYGQVWEEISPDLTKNIDRTTLEIMGVLGSEPMMSANDGTSYFGNIVGLTESPIDPDVLYAGSDDGNLHVTRDGGTTWTNVAPNMPGLPNQTYITRIVASHADAGTVWAAGDNHRNDDFTPYIYSSSDFGQSWRLITNGLPDNWSVNALRQHPRTADLLFTGTEHSVYFSVNAGATWLALRQNLPPVAVDDIQIQARENDRRDS